MTLNRSVPPGPIVPRLIYEDVAKAADWLHGAFGFTERLRTPPEPDGTIHHLQLAVGKGALILTANPPSHPNEYIPALMVHVDDIDAHYERARQFGAKILSPPDTKPFGERQYSAEDFEGHHWAFTESVADVPPESWGALVSNLAAPAARPRLPCVCYLQIPAVDVHQSADFYEKVFGWNIRSRDSDHPRFDDAAGHVSRAWFTGRVPSREAGLIVSVWVGDIDATLARVTANGGEAFETPQPDAAGSTCLIANFRDPAGNLIGLYQEPL